MGQGGGRVALRRARTEGDDRGMARTPSDGKWETPWASSECALVRVCACVYETSRALDLGRQRGVSGVGGRALPRAQLGARSGVRRRSATAPRRATLTLT